MLDQIINRLQGQVRVRVESSFPERVLNLCAVRKLSMWDVRWEGPTAFSCTVSRRDWYVLRLITRKLDCTLTVRKKQGVPYFVGRFRRRQALVICVVICGLWMMLGSFFIWDFTVDGAVTVPEEEILRSLQKHGVGFGTFGFSIDGEDLRNRVLLDIPQLCWLTVNVSGCRAYVQVRERVPAPKLDDRRTPSNVVARRDGLVLKVQALVGQKCVLPGTTVEKGQILISGVQDTGTFGARFTAGMGTVTARTWYRLTATMPLTVEEKVYTGKEKTGFSLIFGTHRIKFYGNGSYLGAHYDKISTRKKLSVFGLPLPITTEEEVCRFYETRPATRAPQEAEAEGKALLSAYLASLLDEDGTVKSTLCSSKRSGDNLIVTLTAECVEQIGITVPIETEESGG